MNDILIKFENDIFKKILNENLIKGNLTTSQCMLFFEQHKSAKIEFINNGVGFYFKYIINENTNKSNTGDMILGGGTYVYGSNSNKYVELILFINNGIISCIEGHGFGEYIDEKFFSDYATAIVFSK